MKLFMNLSVTIFDGNFVNTDNVYNLAHMKKQNGDYNMSKKEGRFFEPNVMYFWNNNSEMFHMKNIDESTRNEQ